MWFLQNFALRFFFFNKFYRDFLGDPVLKTLPIQCRRHRFSPWLGN